MKLFFYYKVRENIFGKTVLSYHPIGFLLISNLLKIILFYAGKNFDNGFQN